MLSEAGTDRSTALKFARQFESVGAKQLAPIKGVNRNVKLNLVSEAFMLPDEDKKKLNDPSWHIKYEIPSTSETSIERRALNLLQISETREIYGLTYRDLIEMDQETFNYISDHIVKMANERIERQKEYEAKEKKNG